MSVAKGFHEEEEEEGNRNIKKRNTEVYLKWSEVRESR
jgi:hypothetical protein